MSKLIDLVMLVAFFAVVLGCLYLVAQAIFGSLKHPGE